MQKTQDTRHKKFLPLRRGARGGFFKTKDTRHKTQDTRHKTKEGRGCYKLCKSFKLHDLQDCKTARLLCSELQFRKAPVESAV
jgi:hypothetical protein